MHQNMVHIPVLTKEVMAVLLPAADKTYIDATIGGGGHTALLLAQGATVLGIDQDEMAIQHVVERFAAHPRLTVVETNFMTIREKAVTYGFSQVDGILFDLGVSSLQLDTKDRGFSFNADAALDMRMSTKTNLTAAEIVNTAAKDELYELLITNAQESRARNIAEAIVTNRPINTTKQLATIVEAVYGGRRGKLHPATKTFQAIRIAVNQELKIIMPALKDAYSLLKIGGKLSVISFHESEDRIVKRTFAALVEDKKAHMVGPQPISPSREEIESNIRARSAKLRTIERLA